GRRGLEQVRHIVSLHPQPEVGGMVEGLGMAHRTAPIRATWAPLPRARQRLNSYPTSVARDRPSSPESGVTRMLEVGQAAPDFSPEDQDGKGVSLSDCKGSTIVLYFYPKDDTPGCTKEACAFRDAFAEYRKRGARIVGVSPDEPSSHARFAKKFDL